VSEEIPSVPELVRALLLADPAVQEVAPGGTVVGPASYEEQQAGCISLNEEGLGERTEPGAALIRHRMACRCLATSDFGAAAIGRAVFRCLHHKGRRVVEQPTTRKSYLVHWSEVRGGPTGLAADQEGALLPGILENRLVVEALVGTQEVVAA
jgi:hypothetical protein